MRIIAVDFQKDFTASDGACYRVRPCVNFILETLVPHCRKYGLRIAEIISDYRPPRPGTHFAHCVPGTTGYESALPADVKYSPAWIKCMHSPVWVRKNGGRAGVVPGLPYPDPGGFNQWLLDRIGPPQNESPVILIGLTLDCCILCTAQELEFRGYQVRFLVEGVDTFAGCPKQKLNLFETPLAFWGQPIPWLELLKQQ